MKKGLIGILSGVIVFTSGMFIGKVATVDKDTHENLKTKYEQKIKEADKSKKDLSKANKELSKLKKIEEKEGSQENNQNDVQTIDKEVKRTSNNVKGYVHENITTKSSDSISDQESKTIENPPIVESEKEVLTPMTPEKPSDVVPIENSSSNGM